MNKEPEIEKHATLHRYFAAAGKVVSPVTLITGINYVTSHFVKYKQRRKMTQMKVTQLIHVR
jgi:hypothetical protein